jgi:recombination protein RecT
MGDTHNAVKQDTLTVVRYNLSEKYLAQVTNFYEGDKSAAMRFMTGYVDLIRRNPKLMECSPLSLVNSAMMIASFRFTPSSVAGEAYIIPYGGEATFQMGYQGYVVLFYRAGVRAIQGEIVREEDDFSLENGIPSHKVDPRKNKEQRGKAIGAYVRVVLPSGEPTFKYMNGEDILAHGKRFSKAFSKPDSPWKESNDPELNMWKKTVLLQMKSMLPKNSELTRAMEEDFKDSTMSPASVLDAGGPAVGAADHTPIEDKKAEPETPQEEPKCPTGKHHGDFVNEKGVCEACVADDKAGRT